MHDRIDISEGIDLGKSNNSKQCMICNYQLFNQGFEFQDSVCNGCLDLTMLSVNISDIIIITVKNVDYRSIILFPFYKNYINQPQILKKNTKSEPKILLSDPYYHFFHIQSQ